jgi:hypothetical protein
VSIKGAEERRGEVTTWEAGGGVRLRRRGAGLLGIGPEATPKKAGAFERKGIYIFHTSSPSYVTFLPQRFTIIT